MFILDSTDATITIEAKMKLSEPDEIRIFDTFRISALHINTIAVLKMANAL